MTLAGCTVDLEQYGSYCTVPTQVFDLELVVTVLYLHQPLLWNK
jgi:hypothetical protein